MYPVPIWHMDPEINMQKYFLTRILSGLYKAVIALQIFNVGVLCYTAQLGSYPAYGSPN